MKEIVIRDVRIGSGMPKICVPLCGRHPNELFERAEYAAAKQPDIVEWRADWLAQDLQEDILLQILNRLRDILQNIPLLYTFRTLQEGGERDIAPEAYASLLYACAKSGLADLADIEAFWDPGRTQEMVRRLQEMGVGVILSHHDFKRTPDKSTILKLLAKMQDYGADIVKIACMPGGFQDAIRFMDAVEEMHRLHAKIPLIAVSMAAQGSISRFMGELFGSCVTFAAAAGASAPGQADIEDTKTVVRIMHAVLSGHAQQPAAAEDRSRN